MNRTLYIVATPIGNLDDFSPRGVETLKNADLILSEDTRVTKKLLSRFKISTPLVSYHQHSLRNNADRIIKIILDHKTIALVTDAGTPGISDPGNELLDYLYSLLIPDLKIFPIPGPSALTAAISVCGFDMSRYTYIGFIPKKRKEKLIQELKNSNHPFIYFDSPHRLEKNLEFIEKHFGSKTRVFIAREITKMYEEYLRGDIETMRQQLLTLNPKGEVVVIVENK